MDAIYAGGALGLILLVLWAATRQGEIFRVSVRDGRVVATRGKVPPSFLGDLRGLVRHVALGTVSAVKQDGHARLVVSPSVDEATGQRLRNAFALTSAAKQRSGL